MKKICLAMGLVLGVAMELVAAPARLDGPAIKAGTTVKPAPVSKPAATVATPTVAVETPVATSRKPVQEEGSAGGLGLTAKLGTLGAGLEATVGGNDYLGFRLGFNMMNAGKTIEQDEGTLNADLEWLSYGGLIDWHLFGGGFRVTGGALINKNKFKLNADLTESVTLDGQEYYLSDLKGQVTFSEFAPYFGIGYGNAVGADGRWHFACDFGVMFQGEPQVEASATASDPALQSAVDEALDREVTKIQEDASSFKYYPVISVGVSYRF